MLSRRVGALACGHHPIPAVGCAIIKSNEVLATGFTHPNGQAHAEVHALSQVPDATGSTVFVTLEPCAHTGLTPPCTQTLIDAGIARVVIACIDPDERVAGRGVEQLRSAGIDVTLGVCESEAADELAGFFLRLKRGYGRVTVKMAMTAARQWPRGRVSGLLAAKRGQTYRRGGRARMS